MFILPVAIEGRIHPIPFRTRKLSSPSPMILPVGGKVGRCGLFFAHFIRPYSGRIFFCLNDFPRGGRAGFKTGPQSVVEGSRTRPDAFFGKYVDFGVRRVPGAFSRVWEGVRNSALFPPRGVHPGSEDAQLSKHALSHARIRFERTFRLFWETCRFRGPSRPRGLLARLGGCPFFRAFSAQRKLGKENAPNPETRSPRP